MHSIGHTIRTFEFEGPSAVDGIRHIEIAFDGAGKHFLVPSKNGAILYKYSFLLLSTASKFVD